MFNNKIHLRINLKYCNQLLTCIITFDIISFEFHIFLTYFIQAQSKVTNALAAAKMCLLEGEDDLSDFMIEIDILSECKHENIVQLYEAYFTNSKLWVRIKYINIYYYVGYFIL